MVFKQAPDIKKFRPDGLIIVSMGSCKFTALVEAKIGNAELKPEQIEAYLDIARQNSIDAVVTISNQFAPLPSHHPVSVSKHKTRTVQLFHWSWQSLFSEAVLLADHDGIDDDEREFLLKELIRFLEHESSGVLAFRQMGRNWKEVCGAAHQGNLLTKTSPEVIDAAASWQQLTRYLSLKLSRAVGRRVAIHMPRKHTSHPEMRLTDIVNRLVGDQRLADEFEIPDAASRLTLLADLNQRTLTAGMTLEAPRDVKRPRASVNWVLRQLRKIEESELIIRADWPGRTVDTYSSLEILRQNPDAIIPTGTKILPLNFEIKRVRDLGGRFRGSSTFVEETEAFLLAYYEEIGQELRPWVPKAPKIIEQKQSLEETDATSGINENSPSAQAYPLPATIHPHPSTTLSASKVNDSDPLGSSPNDDHPGKS